SCTVVSFIRRASPALSYIDLSGLGSTLLNKEQCEQECDATKALFFFNSPVQNHSLKKHFTF
ncbi:MAG TPA: hypothetical protein PL045_09750, partial [Chitinophagaceae bacterium]|nr:hypothetical protein [Chitinophagaceae bacterium]